MALKGGLQAKLKSLKAYRVVIKRHAAERAFQRKVESKEVIENLKNPNRLKLYEQLKSKFRGGRKIQVLVFPRAEAGARLRDCNKPQEKINICNNCYEKQAGYTEEV